MLGEGEREKEGTGKRERKKGKRKWLRKKREGIEIRKGEKEERKIGMGEKKGEWKGGEK